MRILLVTAALLALTGCAITQEERARRGCNSEVGATVCHVPQGYTGGTWDGSHLQTYPQPYSPRSR